MLHRFFMRKDIEEWNRYSGDDNLLYISRISWLRLVAGRVGGYYFMGWDLTLFDNHA